MREEGNYSVEINGEAEVNCETEVNHEQKKRVAVIGDDSYIAQAFAAYAQNIYEIQLINSRNNAWESVDFSQFDALLHCAGIAHTKNVKKEIYTEINRDLTLRVAQKAKREGVSHFLFISSMSVYGKHIGAINLTTPPNPADLYGKSKLEAEKALINLADVKITLKKQADKNLTFVNHTNETFTLSIIRPPMVYGKNCKGNFPRLVSLVKKLPVFPNYPNKRSMIFINYLIIHFIDLINNKKSGIFLPQNNEHICTAQLVKLINNKIKLINTFNPLINILKNKIPVLSKLFGDLYYEFSGEENINAIENLNKIINLNPIENLADTIKQSV